MRLFSPVLHLAAFLTASSAVSAQTLPASDPYRQWAVSKWTEATVANESLRASVWSETANPDGDQFLNLQEYAFDTDPKVRTTTDPVSWSLSVSPGYFTLTFRTRLNDSGLLMLPQVSSQMGNWLPAAPSSVSSWSGTATPDFTELSRTPATGSYATVTWRCAQSVFEVPAQFTRVLVMRGAVSAVTSPTDGLRFHETIAPAGGQTVESNAITPAGFTGTILITVTGGARLIVDGVDVGNSAQVRAGSDVRLRGTSPASGSGSYGVTINGVSSSWTLTTRPPVQPQPVGGTVSGYTPVSASVGENGAANISIPITLPPGTAGHGAQAGHHLLQPGSERPAGPRLLHLRTLRTP